MRTGSGEGPPRRGRAPRVGISSTVFGVRAEGPLSSGRNLVSKPSQIGPRVAWPQRGRESGLGSGVDQQQEAARGHLVFARYHLGAEALVSRY